MYLVDQSPSVVMKLLTSLSFKKVPVGLILVATESRSISTHRQQTAVEVRLAVLGSPP